MKKLFLMFLLASLTCFGAIFNETDSLNLATGIGTNKFPTAVIDVNYQFDADEELWVQLGSQTRLQSGWHDYQTLYAGLLLDTSKFVWDAKPDPDRPSGSERSIILPEKDKEHKLYLLIRLGATSDLDSNSGGLYAATGLQYGQNRFARIMFEAEDGKFRNSIVVGMKFDSLKFY
ncbi:MAG: hypothetical protein ACRCW9_06615 [Cetobacterium sp.]